MQDHLEFLLGDVGLEIYCVDTVKRAQSFLAEKTVELLIIDRGLPDGDGLDLLKSSEVAIVPSIVLSARSELTERIHGLRMGAVEYVPKPFSREELKLRVQRILELRYGLRGQAITVGEVTLFPSSGQVVSQEKNIQLPRRESQLLTVLLRHSGQVLTKSQIIQNIWQQQADQPNDETVEVYVRRLRKSLPVAVRDRLVTVRGYGYRYQA